MAVSRQWQMIRSWLRQTHNKEVHEYFKNNDEALDNSTGRNTTKAVCLIGAQDSQGLAQLKMENFERLKRRAGYYDSPHDFVYLDSPTAQGYPQVQLFFWERYSSAKARGYQQKKVRIAFRVDNENWSEADIKLMASKVKAKFATPIVSFDLADKTQVYFDRQKKIQFKIPVGTKEEAIRLLDPVFELMGKTPDWNKLGESKHPFHLADDTIRVVGETIRRGAKRPSVNCYFKYAIAKVYPHPADFVLVDTTRTYFNALEYVPNPYLGSESNARKTTYREHPLIRR